jgi:tetratricopeptide (TPR) repeat protein
VRAFEYFLEFFPAREVYHNLALSHHLLALQAYQLWKPKTPVLPFQLDLAVEPVTRASQIYVNAQTQRGAASAAPDALFRRHLDESIALYRQALTLDASYTPAALNLAHALIVRGIQTQAQGLSADVVEAQAVLLRLQQSGSNEQLMPQLLNALGVVSFYAERLSEAERLFTRVRTLAPADAAPVLNLAYLAQVTKRPADAKHYQRVYQQLYQSEAHPVARDLPVEQLMGIAVGQFTDEVLSAWGEPAASTFELDKTPLTLSTYPGGVMTLSQDNEILLLSVRRGFAAASVQGIRIGSQAQAVLSHYGTPTRRLAMPRGDTWSYDRHRIAFHLQNGQVVGWLVY